MYSGKVRCQPMPRSRRYGNQMRDRTVPTLSDDEKTSALGKSIDRSIQETFIRRYDKRFAALRRVERHVRQVPLPLLTIWCPTGVDGTSVRMKNRFVVWLSPSLENRPQSYVNFVVAHEIAHWYLGHVTRRQYSRVPNYQIEFPADGLARAWGFHGESTEHIPA